MSETEKISVIVPVYNAEAYLASSLAALSGQTYRNLEIILVDDASTDRSAAICAEYAARDARMILLRKTENQGQGAARNDAMRIASGSMIGFCDSDDIPDPDMFARLAALLTGSNAEIAVCALRTVENRSRRSAAVRVLGPEEATLLFLTDESFGAFSCNKLFRAEALKRGGEYPHFKYEDVAFIPRVCALAERLVRTDEELYFYRQHPQSVTGRAFNPQKMELLPALDELVPFLLFRFPGLAPWIYGKAWFGVMGILCSMYKSGTGTVEQERRLLSRAREYRSRSSRMTAPGKRKAALFDGILRFPLFCKILIRLLFRIRGFYFRFCAGRRK